MSGASLTRYRSESEISVTIPSRPVLELLGVHPDVASDRSHIDLLLRGRIDLEAGEIGLRLPIGGRLESAGRSIPSIESPREGGERLIVGNTFGGTSEA